MPAIATVAIRLALSPHPDQGPPQIVAADGGQLLEKPMRRVSLATDSPAAIVVVDRHQPPPDHRESRPHGCWETATDPGSMSNHRGAQQSIPTSNRWAGIRSGRPSRQPRQHLSPGKQRPPVPSSLSAFLTSQVRMARNTLNTEPEKLFDTKVQAGTPMRANM